MGVEGERGLSGAGADVCFGGEREEIGAGAGGDFGDAIILGDGAYGKLNGRACHVREAIG